jgi:hypothetical protein
MQMMERLLFEEFRGQQELDSGENNRLDGVDNLKNEKKEAPEFERARRDGRKPAVQCNARSEQADRRSVKPVTLRSVGRGGEWVLLLGQEDEAEAFEGRTCDKKESVIRSVRSVLESGTGRL